MEPTESRDEDAGLTDLEADLAALSPAKSRVDRDRLMFLAGRASTPAPRRSPWPPIAAGLGLLALGEAALLTSRPEPQIIERIVVVREPAEVPVPVVAASDRAVPPPRPAETARARRIEQLIRFGLDIDGPPQPLAAGYGEAPRPIVAAGPLRDRDIARLLDTGGPS